jgi:AbrB family transcriptional regulator (stage V sporulation protein T)
MKATGIVRRIDDLGRVVVPKEIRRTLRIREGDPLEIFTDREGEIILKKYSPIGEITPFAQEYAESLAQVSGHSAIITDRDQVIAVSGSVKKDILNRSISKELEALINERESIMPSKSGKGSINIVDTENTSKFPQIITPIICEGDAMGAVIIMAKDEKTGLGDLEKKLASVAAMFLGRQMES